MASDAELPSISGPIFLLISTALVTWGVLMTNHPVKPARTFLLTDGMTQAIMGAMSRMLELAPGLCCGLGSFIAVV
jgi:hypothetical protein